MEFLTVMAWVMLGLPSMALVTFGASRLLGVRRGWLEMIGAGFIGWTLALVAAGQLTHWQWSTFDMVIVTLVLGTILSMVAALALDLFSPPGAFEDQAHAGQITLRNPLASFRLRRERGRRYREIITLGRQNGVVGRHLDTTTFPSGVRKTLEQSGGIFVKLGQVASTRSDVLPASWCAELALLRSSAAAVDFSEVSPVITRELGDPPSRLFESFDPTPIASASIAQIYAATIDDGTPVVVKVQRPGLEERMVIDRSAVLRLAGIAEQYTTLGSGVSLSALASEFLDNVAEELDFEIEATNAAELAEGLAGMEGIRVPWIVADLSTRRVLTEERVSGVSIGDVEAMRAAGLDTTELARRLTEAFVVQIFDVGIFHADPHPGNVLVEEDGTIVLIDLGAVGRLSSDQRSKTITLLAAAASGETLALRQALMEIVEVGERSDLHALDRAIDRLLARHMRSGSGISAAALQDISGVVGQFGLRLPDWLATLSRTMVTLEGTLLGLDPSFSLVDAARAHAGALGAPTSGSDLKGAVQQMALREIPRLRRVPERIDSILGQAAEGRLTARISLFADQRNEEVVTRLTNRLVLGILSAALGIGSVLLIGVKHGPSFGGDWSMNEVLGYVGLASAAVLGMRVIAGIIRDGQN